jgi:hypothetical protein
MVTQLQPFSANVCIFLCMEILHCCAVLPVLSDTLLLMDLAVPYLIVEAHNMAPPGTDAPIITFQDLACNTDPKLSLFLALYPQASQTQRRISSLLPPRKNHQGGT